MFVAVRLLRLGLSAVMSVPRSTARRWLVVAALLLTTCLAWFDLGPWISNRSERFYLLVPPLFAALFCALSTVGWRGLKPHLLMTLVYLGVLAFLCAGYLGFVTLAELRAQPAGVLWRLLREF